MLMSFCLEDLESPPFSCVSCLLPPGARISQSSTISSDFKIFSKNSYLWRTGFFILHYLWQSFLHSLNVTGIF